MGLTQFIIKVDNKEEFKITIEVFPGKISYKEDYKALLNDVNEEIYNLAYGFLARTYLGSDINRRKNNNDTEFYSILNYVFEKLKKSIDIVLNNPNHILKKEDKVVKYHNIRKTTKDTVKYLEKRPHLMKAVKDNKYLPNEALVTKKIMTMDTKENRLLKFMLLKIVDKISKFLNNYKKSFRNNDEIIIRKLMTMKKEIMKRINSSFLRNIENQFNDASMSLVFSMGSGYKEVYKYYLMLQKGLSIKSSLFSLSIKELSLLYEYWCFIKITSILKKKYNLIGGDLLKINRDGITVSLTKGKKSCLKYENPETKEKFTVYYNFQTSSEETKNLENKHTIYSKTVSQKPDNILSLYKEDSSKCYEFIFDAKYKIDYRQEYVKSYGSPGPKEEDINTMHRYRDAIVSIYSKNNDSDLRSHVKNNVFGAFVLFPYNDEEKYKENTFYKSIDEVNIGAFPFLPSTTKLMEQFEANINNKYYHIPVKSVNLAAHSIEYVTLFQTKNIFNDESGIQYYGQVADIKIVKRSEITELPKESSELYYRIEVSSWIKLYRKLEINGFSLRRSSYTSFYLLKNADNVCELFIRNCREFRLFRELRRIYNKRTISLKGIEDDVEAFCIDDIEIIVKGDVIKIIRGNLVLGELHYSEFLKSPVRSLKKIM